VITTEFWADWNLAAPKTLTLAAERLEALDAAATPGPWEIIWDAVAYVDTIADPNDLTGQTPMQDPVKVADAGEADRAFIAAMRGVAKPLAAWLREAAELRRLGVFTDAALPLAREIIRATGGPT
jgi:hypothetical protein